MKVLRLLGIGFASGFSIVLISAGLYALWLLWPLPEPDFDWQEAVAAYAAHGDCASAQAEVELAAVTVPDVAIAGLSHVTDVCRAALGALSFDRWATEE